jgi:hypothetical protein
MVWQWQSTENRSRITFIGIKLGAFAPCFFANIGKVLIKAVKSSLQTV